MRDTVSAKQNAHYNINNRKTEMAAKPRERWIQTDFLNISAGVLILSGAEATTSNSEEIVQDNTFCVKWAARAQHLIHRGLQHRRKKVSRRKA